MKTRMNLCLLAVSVALTACGSGADPDDKQEDQSQLSAIAAADLVTIGQITGTSEKEKRAITKGVAMVNDVLHSACFRTEVLNGRWTETRGMTQAQIYELLTTRPMQVDVDVFMGTWWQNHVSKTIGYEDEPGVVHVNRYFVQSAYEFGDNIIHEVEGHSQGFSHFGVKATSVPYMLNEVFETCSEG